MFAGTTRCGAGLRAARLHHVGTCPSALHPLRSLSSLSTITLSTRRPRSPFPLPSTPRRNVGYRPPTSRAPILPSPLVTPQWLAEHLPRVKVLDGSWHMPAEKRDAKKDFERQRIPTAQSFDIDLISDHATSLPHMLPAVSDFANAVGQLGLRSDDPIVVYDTKGVFSAARVWFTFRCFGARDVAVLQGGLPLWLHHKLPTESGPASSPTPFLYIPTDRTSALVRTYPEMLRNATSLHPEFQVLDARSRGRFSGVEAEPRAGMSSGHMPGAVNVPYGELVEKREGEGEGVQLKSVEGLLEVMRKAGVRLDDRNAPIVTTCGTGVTASVVALALELLGHKGWSLYDGSWSEWAQQKGAPIVKDVQKAADA